MRRLTQYQIEFSRMLSELIQKVYKRGYGIIIGEVQRSQDQANKNAQLGTGISNSLHVICLAADLELISPTGKWLNTFDEMVWVGEMWEDMGGNWGGRFKIPDCPHFSTSYPYDKYKGVR